MQVTTVGLDVAKNVFQAHGVDHDGRVVLRRRLRRATVLAFFANLPRCVIGLEACGGAHYWARELTKLGHDARLMPPQYVKAYVKTNKHDAADAEACCEAVQRPGMRFVPVKNAQQQALLLLHRIRDRLSAERTGTINAIRGDMAEFGMVAAQRHAGLKDLVAIIADGDDVRLLALARELLVLQVEHLRQIEARIAALDRQLVRQARDDDACRRLTAAPGIGPVIATAMVATIGNARLFSRARSFAAWLGLTPRQHATGGKERLLRISKRGNGYLRRQLIHGPGAGQGQSRAHRQAVGVEQRLAGAPAVQRRGRGGGQQAGAADLGDAQPRRGVSRRMTPRPRQRAARARST